MGKKPASSKLPLKQYESLEQFRLRTWVQLARTFQIVAREVARLLAEHDVTMPQFDVLATLRYSEGVTQQELARRLLVTKGNVCGLLDRLERSRWVERRSDENDARTNRLHLTAAGRRVIDRLLPRHDKLVLKVFADLGADEIRPLRAALETIEQRAAND